MKYILTLLITISFAFGQVFTLIGMDGEKDTVIKDNTPLQTLFDKKGIVTLELGYGIVEIPTSKSYEIYAEECYNDTIRLKKVGDEYIFMYEHYGEMFTKRQLNQREYFYQYRWITNTVIDEEHPMEFEYIFVKEPRLPGFIEWLKDK